MLLRTYVKKCLPASPTSQEEMATFALRKQCSSPFLGCVVNALQPSRISQRRMHLNVAIAPLSASSAGPELVCWLTS